MRNNKDIKYSIDLIKKENNKLTIIGWANAKDPDQKVYIDVTDENGQHIQYRKTRTLRKDVSMARYGEILDSLFGFTVTFTYDDSKTYYFNLFTDQAKESIKINHFYILADNIFKRISAFVWRKPLQDALKAKPINYHRWYLKTKPKKEELQKQRAYDFGENAPKFSIVIPLYKTPRQYLQELIQSIRNQTYQNFEVCFADGSPIDAKLDTSVSFYSKKDPRFKYHFIGENKGISGNTNEALKMATGDFIVLCDHDDLLTPNALFEFAQAIVVNPTCDTLYSDEDKVNGDGSVYFDPHFKPDYNIDLLTSTNYICHLFGVRRTLVEKSGGFNSEYDGAQDFEFILRLTQESRTTIHIPKVLYHWRTHQNSTSENPESKMYAFENGKKVISDFYKKNRPDVKVSKVEHGISLGIYHTCFEFDKQPLISIIIPNMDHTDDLDKAIRSVITEGTWKNLEFIIIENNSKEEKTFAYYEKIQKEFPQVRVVYYKDKFNYSKLNNFGVTFAKGDYYLFMNNDVELIEPDSIKEMMGYAQRKDVGIVGCRLMYEDDTIQHAGVVVGILGIAGHVFNGNFSIAGDSYFNRAMTVQDYSAVTAAVMLVRKDAYEAVSGFDENFAVAFNDIDFCLKVRALNKLVVYTPYAAFHHYESKSRGAEDTFEKRVRFVSEIQRFVRHWKDFLILGDPFYNPNFTVHSGNYGCRDLAIENIGDPFYSPQYMEELSTKTPEEIVKENYQD